MNASRRVVLGHALLGVALSGYFRYFTFHHVPPVASRVVPYLVSTVFGERHVVVAVGLLGFLILAAGAATSTGRRVLDVALAINLFLLMALWLVATYSALAVLILAVRDRLEDVERGGSTYLILGLYVLAFFGPILSALHVIRRQIQRAREETDYFLDTDVRRVAAAWAAVLLGLLVALWQPPGVMGSVSAAMFGWD